VIQRSINVSGVGRKRRNVFYKMKPAISLIVNDQREPLFSETTNIYARYTSCNTALRLDSIEDYNHCSVLLLIMSRMIHEELKSF
jgi:hypothetical protein